MKDIENLEDIKVFVDDFYQKIKIDDLIGPVFIAQIGHGDWSKHLHRMYQFWDTVLFFQRSYKGNPFSKHAHLPIEGVHFERWITLFHQTIDQHFEGVVADDVKNRAAKMGLMFQSKLMYLKNNPQIKPVM